MHSHQTISTSRMYNFDIFSLGPNHSYFAQGIYLIDKTENIPCAILEWSDTILELRNQVGILTLRRAILEWYRFLLCAEHIYVWREILSEHKVMRSGIASKFLNTFTEELA